MRQARLPSDPPHVSAHRHSIRHRQELLESQTCGCFYCLSVFVPSEIVKWTDQNEGVGQTAICPRCGIDSVIGSSSGYTISKEFLSRMRAHWFG
jgi:hypothetical protein